MLIGRSLSETADMLCPACAYYFEAQVWLIVDAQERPDLHDAIVRGTIADLPCPACETSGSVTAPLLYHNGQMERFILALPLSVGTPEDARSLAEQLNTLFLDSLSEKPDPLPPYLQSVELVAELDGLQAILGAEIDQLTPALEALLAAEHGEAFQRVLAQYRSVLMQPHVDTALEQVITQADATLNPLLGRRAREYRATLAQFRETWVSRVQQATELLDSLGDLPSEYAEVVPALHTMLQAIEPQDVYAARIQLSPAQQARVDVLIERLLGLARDSRQGDVEAYLLAMRELKNQ